jgi:LDH2 family malate/lactate/ureidoglycolate dehydrogenase
VSNIACHVLATGADGSVATVAEVSIAALHEALLARAAGLGFEPSRAAIVCDHFLDAELRGAATHGAERMRWLAGFSHPDPNVRPRQTGRSEGLSRWDGAGAVGYAALAEALDRETDPAPTGARLVVVERCFPTGRLGWFAERVARRGLVCLLTATSTARIAHPGGGPPILGTNPICLALPGPGEPTVVDVSMGRITYGAVLHAAATGASLPAGAARGPDGAPETDPAEIIADRAGIVPFGAEQAYKGFALAAVVELLCGTLAGTDGHAAVALLAQPHAEAVARLRELVGERRFPGDHSARARAEALRRGTVAIPDDLWAWLEAGR